MPRLGGLIGARRKRRIDQEYVKARAKALRDAVAVERQTWLAAQIGTMQQIAVENGGVSGHAENFAYVKLDKQMTEGSIVRAVVNELKDGTLLAEVVE